MDKCRVLNFYSLGGFLLRKKCEKCYAFLVPSLHCKLALFRVTLSLHSFAPLRNWLRQPLQSLPLFKIKKLEIEPKFFFYLNFSFSILFGRVFLPTVYVVLQIVLKLHSIQFS